MLALRQAPAGSRRFTPFYERPSMGSRVQAAEQALKYGNISRAYAVRHVSKNTAFGIEGHKAHSMRKPVTDRLNAGAASDKYQNAQK